MHLPIIAANWKMNTTVAEAAALVESMRGDLDKITDVERVLCPPFISLTTVREMLKGCSIKLGAQDVFHEPKGAYTGEISPLMLVGLCEYVLVGHSERRNYFHESGDVVNRKVKAVLKAGLKPILCVGESADDKEAGHTEAVVAEQLRDSLDTVSDVDGMVISYEPVWAIGTGRAASGKQANSMAALIRHDVTYMCGKSTAHGLRILYGGSVTPANIAEFVRQPGIDGALVGGASLRAADFVSIVQQTSAIRAAKS